MTKGKLAFTNFFVALLSIMFSAFGAGQIGADFSLRQLGLEARARLFEIVDGSKDEDDPLSTEGSKLKKLQDRIQFSSCHFAYPTRPNTTPIYYRQGGRDGFSLEILAKQSMAFIGRSGCGKSTALQLALRFCRIDSGAVMFDGKDISDINLG
eukprot:jgi/Psemu1/218647/e_gw1.920.13.1